MTCQFASDYRRVGGFNASIRGWGLEDVDLYRKHVRRGSAAGSGRRLTVVRAADPGLVHPWHEKTCDRTQLSADQFRGCVQSRAVGEASHVQLGLHVLQQQMAARETAAGSDPPSTSNTKNAAADNAVSQT